MSKRKKNIDYTHGLCKLSVVPVRKKADDTSEIVSQLLFGELMTIVTHKNKSWIKVACEFDDYVGWVDPKQIKLLEAKEYETLKAKGYSTAFEVVQPIMHGSETFPILLGSSLPKFDGFSFSILGEKYVYSGQAINKQEVNVTAELITKVAKKYLNAPYLWGGRSPFGIDCSGLTQCVFKILGLKLPRDAYQQAEHGEMVDFVSASNVGDLAFFENKEGKIHHVGIILENNEIIHASGFVRIDKIDHFGIYHNGSKRYTHKLRFVKRLAMQ